eukprot:COSAG06_NODE_400_length_16205_cov_13.911275_1_plen_616_part_00
MARRAWIAPLVSTAPLRASTALRAWIAPPRASTALRVDGAASVGSAPDDSFDPATAIVMEEEFDKQQPGLPGAMTPAVLQQTHAKLLARSARWEGSDAPSAAQLRMIEQVIDARLQAQYAARIEEIETDAHARIGRVLALRSAAPNSFNQAMIHTALVDQEGRLRSTRAAACLAPLVVVLLSLAAVLSLTHAAIHPACVTNAQCASGDAASYCSPVDGRCRYCASAALQGETGAVDAIGFCDHPRLDLSSYGGFHHHPACEACTDSDGFGQWNLVALQSDGGGADSEGWESLQLVNTTWGTSSESRAVSERLAAMRFSDILVLVLSAAVIACCLSREIRDIKLCELDLRRREGKPEGRVSTRWRWGFWLSCMIRQYALLPAVAASLPLLLIGGGGGGGQSESARAAGDARTVCTHALGVCFSLLALDYAAYEYSLPVGSRIAAEDTFALSRSQSAGATATYASSSASGGTPKAAALSHSREEGARLVTNEVARTTTAMLQFAAMLAPVMLARASARADLLTTPGAGGTVGAGTGGSGGGGDDIGGGDGIAPALVFLGGWGGPYLASLLSGVLEASALPDSKMTTGARLWCIGLELMKWGVGLLIYIATDAMLLAI